MVLAEGKIAGRGGWLADLEADTVATSKGLDR